MSSLLWRSAAAARRQLSRPPSARTAIRSMASSSSSSSSDNMKRASWLITANILVFNAWIYSLNNKTIAHTEEMRSIRQEIQRLQASNTELQRDLTSRRHATN